jgi:hypothetical protein
MGVYCQRSSYSSSITVQGILHYLLPALQPVVERLVIEKPLKCPVGITVFFFRQAARKLLPRIGANVMAAIVFFIKELFFCNGNRTALCMPQSMGSLYKRADELAVYQYIAGRVSFVYTCPAGMTHQLFDEPAKVVHMRFGKKVGNYLVRVCNAFAEPALGGKRVFVVFGFHLFYF